MKITYDPLADAAYIYIAGKLGFGQVKKQYHCDLKQVKAIINLDFDEEDRLVGIEVLSASRYLPKESLKDAEIASQ